MSCVNFKYGYPHMQTSVVKELKIHMTYPMCLIGKYKYLLRHFTTDSINLTH